MNKEMLLKELINFPSSNYNIILLDGPWGSGKTYLLREAILKNENKDLRYYYVSLHGLKNIDEINTNLFMKAHKEIKSIDGIIPNVINPFNEETDTLKTLEYLLKINKLKANKIIILDDLERYASSDYDSFLSYLTSLIGTGAKIIVVSNLLDFGTSELYLFNQYKEKIFDRVYKAQLFDSKTIDIKFGKYQNLLDETIVLLTRQNYRIVEKVVDFMDEALAKIEENNIHLSLKNKHDLLYYITMFLSTYYESARSYLNKVCERLSVEKENELRKLLKTENCFLDVNLICIEHLNLKSPKPSLNNDHLLFEALYEAYMYCEYENLFNYIKLEMAE